MTGTPSLTSLFAGSGVSISNTHSYESLPLATTSPRLEYLAKCVCDTAKDRTKHFSTFQFDPSVAAGFTTSLTFWP